MNKTKIFLIVQSAVCILAVIMLSAAAIGIYRDGKARKAEDPTEYIYTREAAADAAAPGVKVLLAGLGLTVIGWLFGIRDEKEKGIRPLPMEKPYRIPESRLNKIRLVVLALAVIFIIAGIANGNMHAVLVKAINICTECVGLG